MHRDELNNLVNTNFEQINPAPQYKVRVATLLVQHLNVVLEHANVFLEDVDDTDEDYMDVYREQGSCTYVLINGLEQYSQAVSDLWEAVDEYFILSENDVSLEPIAPGPMQSVLLGNIFRLCNESKHRCDLLSFSVTSSKPEDEYLPPALV